MDLLDVVYLLMAVALILLIVALFLGAQLADVRSELGEANESLRLRTISVEAYQRTTAHLRSANLEMHRLLLARGLTPPALAMEEEDPLTAAAQRRFGRVL